MPDLRHGWIKACQLKRRTVGAVAHMMPDWQALVDRDHFRKEILMVSADHNDGVLLHELQDEPLHLDRLRAAVEDVAQDDQFVRLGIVEIPRLIQRFMKFGIKAVNIGGDIVFHRFKRKASRLLVCMWH